MADQDDAHHGPNSTDEEGVKETTKGKGKAVFTDRLQASGRAAFQAVVTETSAMPDIVSGQQKTAATAGPSSSSTHLEEASWRRAVKTDLTEPFRVSTMRSSSSEAFSSFIEEAAREGHVQPSSSSSIADQEAADGMAITQLLSLLPEEADEYEIAKEHISPPEAARLREALFTNDNIIWNQLLDFTPDFLNSQSDAPSSADASRLLYAGTADKAVARTIWLHQWSDVFDSYTPLVWGDLGPLAADAEAEVKQNISGAENNRETRALQRLRLVLAHLRGSL